MAQTREKAGLIGFRVVEQGQGRILLVMAALMIGFGWIGAGAGFWGPGRPGVHGLGDQAVWVEIVSPDIPHHIRPFKKPPLLSDLLKTLGLAVPDTLEDRLIRRSCRAVIHRGAPRITIRPLSGAAALILGGRININLAAYGDLVQISGIGPVTARRMIENRNRNGPFLSLDDLARVRGIGPETIDRITPYITTENDGPFLEASGLVR